MPVTTSCTHSTVRKKYIRKQWTQKSTIGPERISVANSRDRTNNGVESFHAAFRRRVRVSHPNLFVFLKHLTEVSQDTVGDCERLTHGRQIRRPKKKVTVMNDKRIKMCTDKFTSGVYTRYEFLSSVSHAADNLQSEELDDSDSNSSSDDGDDTDTYDVDEVMASSSVIPSADSTTPLATAPPVCDVCLLEPRASIALVPCGHSRFCQNCADELTRMNLRCPLCRSDITLVMQLYS
jgi:hypothetical protein